MRDNELYHYGIKGQKWGIRRYQNKDGTLTNAGKKRLAKEEARIKSEKKVLQNRKRTQNKIKKLEDMQKELDDQKRELDGYSNSSKKSNSSTSSITGHKKKTIKEMTNEELQAKIDRINFEKRYSEAISSQEVKRETSKGEQFVIRVMERAGEDIATQTVKYLMGTGVNAVMKRVFDDPQAINPKKGQKDK